MEACTGAEGICILTEVRLPLSLASPSSCSRSSDPALCTQWDEFKQLDWPAIYESMAKPAMVFDGRGILEADKLREIGFKVFSIGKGVNL